MFLSLNTELTRFSKVAEVIQKGDLQKSLRGLRELQPWSAPEMLAHVHRSVFPPTRHLSPVCSFRFLMQMSNVV